MLWQDALALLADVAYVDMLEGDTECHIRFNTPEDAQTVMKSHKEIQIKNNWKYEVLTGKIFFSCSTGGFFFLSIFAILKTVTLRTLKLHTLCEKSCTG